MRPLVAAHRDSLRAVVTLLVDECDEGL